ncbi:MAG: HesA/MoeB/ThiF family protein [Candidatus Methanospirareceae archaeon]
MVCRELERYSRQIKVIGEEGQRKLKEAKIFIAGAGGLGSSISIYMAIAGVGRMRIVDKDVVELSNLNRQILYWEEDVGKKKAETAEEKIKRINPDIEVEVLSGEINERNAHELVGDADLILDAVDNFETRYLLNRVALERGIPFFHGAVHGFEGQVTTIIPGKTPCLRCIFPKAPKQEEVHVIGVTPGIIGLIQATEAIKYITGVGELLTGRLLIWSGWGSRFEEVIVKKDPKCEDCGDAEGNRF